MKEVRSAKLKVGASAPVAPGRRVRPSRHAELVADIGRRIIGGEYKPGDSLPTEAELGEMLGVSRNGVREAVKVLASKGLIVSRTKNGISVRPHADWNMLDPEILRWCVTSGATRAFWHSVYEVRKIVEPGAAALAARDASLGDIDDIDAAYADMMAADPDTDAALQADLAFHLSILQASNNPFVRSFGALIETALASTIRAQNARAGAFARSRPLHGLVLEAIRERDPDNARRAANDLLDDVYDSLESSARRVAGGLRIAISRGKPK